MTKIVLIAGALILASHAAAWAEPKSTTGHGASEYAPGDRMHELRSSWDRHGMAAVKAPTAAEADQLAKAMIDRVTVKVRPADD